jgi:hypothetical protein
VAVHVECVYCLAEFVDGGYRWRCDNCGAVDAVCGGVLVGALETLPDAEDAVDDHGVDTFFPLELEDC